MAISYSPNLSLALIFMSTAAILFIPNARKQVHAILLLIILPSLLLVLPNHTIDPWNLCNPYKFCLLIITISAIQFSGYLAVKFFGQQIGIILTGFIGGFISSTAVYATLPDALTRHKHYENAVIASAILSILAMLLEISTILFVASPELFFYVSYPIIAMIGIGLLIAMFYAYRQKRSSLGMQDELANPINIESVVKISLFLGVTLIVIAIAKRYLGTEGLLILSFLGGLFEIHGITLASALLYIDHNLKISDAASVLYIAITASFVSKFFILAMLTPRRIAVTTSLLLLGILSTGWLVIMI